MFRPRTTAVLVHERMSVSSWFALLCSHRPRRLARCVCDLHSVGKSRPEDLRGHGTCDDAVPDRVDHLAALDEFGMKVVDKQSMQVPESSRCWMRWLVFGRTDEKLARLARRASRQRQDTALVLITVCHAYREVFQAYPLLSRASGTALKHVMVGHFVERHLVLMQGPCSCHSTRHARVRRRPRPWRIQIHRDRVRRSTEYP